MTKAITALDTTAFRGLAEEKVLQFFSFCQFQDLGRLARVCEIFKRISEDNVLWKALYEKRWGHQSQAGESFNRKWKKYYRRAVILNMGSQAPHNSALLWRRGLPLAAIGCLSENPNAKWNPVYRALMNLPFTVQSSEDNALHTALAQILKFFEKDKEQAFAVYIAHRAEFIKRYPVLGAWLSMFFQKFRTTKLVQDQMIFFPNYVKDGDSMRQFLQGASIVLLDRGKVSEALVTFECLNMLRQRDKTTDSQEEEKCYCDTIRQGVHQDPSVRLFEKLGDLLSEHKGFTEMAIEAYAQALKTQNFISIDNQMLIAVKLCEELIRTKSRPISPDILQLPLNAFMAFVKDSNRMIDLVPLTSFLIMATCFEFKPLYEPLLKETHLPHYHNRLCSDGVPFYYYLFKLCQLAGRMRDAVHVWNMLCQCLSKNFDEEDYGPVSKNLYKIIYALLDKSPEACDEMLKLSTSCKLSQVGIAYALHRSEKSESALKLMVQLTPFVEPQDIQWIDELSHKYLAALLIYSLTLSQEQEIDGYFAEKSDQLTELQGYICYNMAVRLYYQGFTQAALESLDSALVYHFDEPEFFVMQGLCYRAKGKRQQAEEAFDKAHALDPKYTSNRSYDNQLDLLIFYHPTED